MLRHRKGDALAKKAVKKAVTKKVLTRKVMKKAKGGGGIGTTAGRPLGDASGLPDIVYGTGADRTTTGRPLPKQP